MNNGTNSLHMMQLGQNYTTSGVFASTNGVLYGTSNIGISAQGYIAFSTNSGPEVARFDTSGRLGIGICYECILAYTPKLFSLGDIDLILMPHCAPSPQQSFGISKADVEYWDTTLKDHARRYAAMFGVPAVLINHCGPMESPLPGLFVTQKSRFPGGSGIADSDGTLKAQLGAEEKVIVEDVTLDPARKTRVAPRTHGRWAMELPWKVNAFRFVEFCGELWYSMSAERKRRAREISGG